MDNDTRLRRYVRRGNRTIEGWLSPLAADAILQISEVQELTGLPGSVCEIGVHYGRLFILLCLIVKSNELAVGYDLFDRQNENTDNSGRGNLARFLDNVRKHGGDQDRVKAITANSMELTVDRIIADCAIRPRIFSIDGGHTSEITVNDLRLAADSIAPGGVIVLDDFFSETWPGVATGTCRYFLEEKHELIPLAVAGNKLFFTNSVAWSNRYKDSLRALGTRYYIKTSNMFDHDLIVLWGAEKPLRTRISRYVERSEYWRHVRDTKIGELLLRLHTRYFV